MIHRQLSVVASALNQRFLLTVCERTSKTYQPQAPVQIHQPVGSAAAALKRDASPSALAQAAQAGLDAIQHYGGARPGDRTMLDALAPATAALKKALTQGAAVSIQPYSRSLYATYNKCSAVLYRACLSLTGIVLIHLRRLL